MHSDEVITPETIQGQLGSAYDRFEASDQSQHVDLLRSIVRPEDIGVRVQRASGGRWVVTVCTSDQIGALSVIAGLFAAYYLDISRVDVFTLHFEGPAGRSVRPRQRLRQWRRRHHQASYSTSKLLDVFEVRPRRRLAPRFWARFQADLATLMGRLVTDGLDSVREEVLDRVTSLIQFVEDRTSHLFPVAIELTNDTSPDYTRLAVKSTDTVGFLFAFANALTMARVNIEQAEIRTVGGEVQDTFWLTDPRGRKITDEQRIDELRVATALIKHFTHLVPRSPNPAQSLRQFHALIKQLVYRSDWTRELKDLQSPAVLETLTELLGVSQFLWEDFLRMQHENLFPVLADIPALDQRKSRERLREDVESPLGKLRGHEDQVLELNRFKDREMFRIDLRHITHRIGFREFSEELTDLAEIVVSKAVKLSTAKIEGKLGVPMLENGLPCRWCLCAIGKFGGRELGFGSDIELIFVYEGEGTTSSPAPTQNSQYFGELVREFTGTVKARLEGIFEIDLRLRPYGTAGALASSLSGFSGYYSEGGPARRFERLALVKLRPVAGDPDLASRVVDARDAFVYSGSPVDVENILHLRRRQASELVAPGAVNAKYSQGGLVDLEYFVQAAQIAAGHSDPAVRVTATLAAIDRLAEGGYMPTDLAREVGETYQFLRRLIDALRVVRGHAKDLTIPDADSREFDYLARRLGSQSSGRLHTAIAERMNMASAVWSQGVPDGSSRGSVNEKRDGRDLPQNQP